MAESFKLQDPGEGIHEAEILDVHVSAGDEVAEGDIVLSIETDKAAVDVPAPFTGTVESVDVSAGDQVKVGATLMTYSSGGNEREDAGRGDSEENTSRSKEAVDRASIGEDSPGEDPSRRPVPASPATRRLARELGVKLREVEGTGPKDRVESEDVRSAAAPRDEEAESAPSEEAESAPRKPAGAVEDFARWGPVETEELTGIRRATAANMSSAWSEIPHVTHMDLADITELEGFRAEHRGRIEEEGEGRLTLTVLVLKATAAVLKEYPRFNASLDPENQQLILKRYYHIGVAVATDRGLVVPVVRDVDSRSIVDLAGQLGRLVEKVREKDITREDLDGGTFTVTNPGRDGGTGFTPIIRHPEVAILGIAAARRTPVLSEDGSMVPRLQLPLCLAFDHRVNDGADAMRFMVSLKERLSDPAWMLLTV